MKTFDDLCKYSTYQIENLIQIFRLQDHRTEQRLKRGFGGIMIASIVTSLPLVSSQAFMNPYLEPVMTQN